MFTVKPEAIHIYPDNLQKFGFTYSIACFNLE